MSSVAHDVPEQLKPTSPLPAFELQDSTTEASSSGFYGIGVSGYTTQFQMDGMSLEFDAFTEPFNWVRLKA
jgi:hypothetical protein